MAAGRLDRLDAKREWHDSVDPIFAEHLKDLRHVIEIAVLQGDTPRSKSEIHTLDQMITSLLKDWKLSRSFSYLYALAEQRNSSLLPLFKKHPAQVSDGSMLDELKELKRQIRLGVVNSELKARVSQEYPKQVESLTEVIREKKSVTSTPTPTPTPTPTLVPGVSKTSSFSKVLGAMGLGLIWGGSLALETALAGATFAFGSLLAMFILSRVFGVDTLALSSKWTLPITLAVIAVSALLGAYTWTPVELVANYLCDEVTTAALVALTAAAGAGLGAMLGALRNCLCGSTPKTTVDPSVEPIPTLDVPGEPKVTEPGCLSGFLSCFGLCNSSPASSASALPGSPDSSLTATG